MRAVLSPCSAQGRVIDRPPLQSRSLPTRSRCSASASKAFPRYELVYLNLPAWQFGLCHFHKLVNSAETSRQLICEDAGGNGSCTTTFTPSSLSAVPCLRVALALAGSAAPSTRRPRREPRVPKPGFSWRLCGQTARSLERQRNCCLARREVRGRHALWGSAVRLPPHALQRVETTRACYLVIVHEITRAPPGEASFRNVCCSPALHLSNDNL